LSIRSFVEDGLKNIVGISIIDIVDDVESVNKQTRSSEGASLYVNEKSTRAEVGGERLSVDVELISGEVSSSSAGDLKEVNDGLVGQVEQADVPLSVISDFGGGREVQDGGTEREFVIAGDRELEAEQVIESPRGAVVAEEGDAIIGGVTG